MFVRSREWVDKPRMPGCRQGGDAPGARCEHSKGSATAYDSCSESGSQRTRTSTVPAYEQIRPREHVSTGLATPRYSRGPP